MNLNQDNFYRNLTYILHDLKNLNPSSENYINYISDRLNKSLITYSNELDRKVFDLSKQSPNKILKHLSD